MDVTSIGDINIDVLTSPVKAFPKKDSQLVLSDIRVTSGGCSANFAKAAALLGLETRLFGKIGKDFFGDMVRSDLGKVRGLDLRLSTEGRTSVTLAVSFNDQSRSFLTFPGANSSLRLRDIDFDLVRGRYVHVASFFLQGLRSDTKRVFDYAHARGMLVSFDPGFDPSGWSREDSVLIKKALREVDIFFPNLHEAQAVTGLKDMDKVCDSVLGMGPSVLCLKLGKKGSYVCNRKERHLIPPFKVNVVDTTGAGDVFDAAFVYGHSKGWDLKKAGTFANAAAALSTTGYGSESYPDLDDVLSLSGVLV